MELIMLSRIQYQPVKLTKYRLAANYVDHLKVRPPNGAVVDVTGEIEFHEDGRLVIRKGYMWDGATGPSIDTKTIMRPSLVHDAFYQLMKDGLLPTSYRKTADDVFYGMCRKDGMNRIRAWYSWLAVRLFGGIVLRLYPTRSPVEVAP